MSSGRTWGAWKKLAIAMAMAIAGCTAKDESAPIVVPPGTLVEYTTSEFVQTSGEFYTVELKRWTQNSAFESVEDLTPKGSKSSAQTIEYVIPKDKTAPGTYIVQVNFSRENISYSGFVVPGVVTRPRLASTLVVNLLTQYTSKKLETYTANQIKKLEEAAQKVIDKKTLEIPIPTDTSITATYKYFQNAVGSDAEFLDVCDDAGAEFSYNSSGIVTAAPYPFGRKNLVPILDTSNSTPTNRDVRGIEKEELLIQAQGIDSDNDLVLYKWTKENVVTGYQPNEYRWTPTYDEGRPTAYHITATLSDGSTPQKFEWTVYIENRNRKPEVKETCTREVEEWTKYVCHIEAIDFDTDPLSFQVIDAGLNARVLVNGQQTDDTTRKILVSNVTAIDIEFTPNNNDALRRSAYIEVIAQDTNGGQTTLPLNLAIRDINSPPGVNGGAVQLPLGGGDHEWDYCADVDPDGIGPYLFYVRVDDPDNQTSAAPRNQHPDIVDVNFGGTLKDDVKIINNPIDTPNFIPNASSGCPANTVESTYFCFLWKPKNVQKTGTLTLLAKDNHGGIAALQTVNLIAYDRNVSPCITGAKPLLTTFWDANATGVTQFSAHDDDGDDPNILLKNISPKLVPLLRDCTNGSGPVVLRQTAFEANELWYRYLSENTNSGNSKACLGTSLTSSYSGVVEFSRATSHTAPVTIPAGYTLETPLATGLRIQYKVPNATTINPEDVRVLVPIQAINRTASAGSLNRFVAAPPQPDMTVTNAASLTGGGSVTFNRLTTTSPVVIPAGTVVSTSELSGPTVSSIRYQTMNPATMAVGVASLVVPVARVALVVNPNELTSMTGGALPGPALTIKNPAPAKDTASYFLYSILGTGSTLGSDLFCYNFYAEDMAVSGAGQVNVFAGALPEPGLTVSNPGSMTLYGQVTFTRASAATPLTIPAGTVLKTFIGTKYKTSAALTIPAGTLTGVANVTRDSYLSPVASGNEACVGFSDTNYAPILQTSTNMQAMEAQTTLGFPIEVTDNVGDPTTPNDPADRHEFTLTSLGATPIGPISFCRDPGTDPSDISVPACVPCTDLSGDYFRANKCYIRFKPASGDIGQNYQYTMTIKDHGMTFPSGRNQLQTVITINVGELNDPPVFTDSNYAPLVGNSVATAPTLGSFVENTQSDYFFYATDPDKTDNLKRLGFSLDPQVYDVQKAAWVTAPSGMTLQVVNYNGDPAGTGWGSRSQVKLSWKPTDFDAKRLAGMSGFIVKVKASDSLTDATAKLSTFGYFKVTVVNINNTPLLKAITGGNILTINADSYYKSDTSLVTLDQDNTSLGAPVNHTTYLSLCKSTSVFDCTAPLDAWPDEIKTYDPNYNGNSAVPSCRSGSIPNPSLGLPRLTRLNSVAESENSTTLRYRYRFEWCPQKQHIGTYQAFIFTNDNGDKDRNSVASTALGSTAPLTLKVVAPVFFVSPGRDNTGAVVTYMRQAFAGVTPIYTYYTIIKNSRGNAVTYSLVTPPTGMTISSTGVITWKPTSAQITDSNPLNWPIINVRVRDNVTGETDTVSYRLEVKNPLSPTNVAPVISDKFPATATVAVKERTHQTFQIVASDTNNNPLFYRWFVDGVIKFDGSSQFDYFPSVDDGFIDGDGAGPLKLGQHTIRAEVTDGSNVVTNSWTVNVINTIPSPLLSYNLLSAVTGITNLNISPHLGVAIGAAGATTNSLLFSGSYTRSGVGKSFVYNLKFANGSYSSNTFTEALPWPAGRSSERIAYTTPSGTSFNVQVTSQVNRFGPFGQLTDAVNLASTLGMTSLNPAHLCTGGCPQNLFVGPDSFGNRPSAKYAGPTGQHLFYASDAGDGIQWDIDGSSPQTIISFTGGLRVASLAINAADKRLYASVRDVGNQINRIYVFDITPVNSGVIPTTLTPSGINISDGVDANNRILDLVVIPTTKKVYALLPGTGGVAVLTDPISSTPTSSDVQFIGVAEIASSYSEGVGEGRRLVYNPTANLLYGVSKDSQQVYSIDPTTNELKVYAADVGFDSLVTYGNDLLTLAISKTLGRVYILR